MTSPIHTETGAGSGPASPPAATSAATESLERVRGDNLDLLKALFLGALLTALFYEVFPLPFLDQGRLLTLFENPVSQLIVGMTFWSLFLLLFKYLRFRVQRKALQAFFTPDVQAVLHRGVYAREIDQVMERLTEALARLRVKRFASSVIYRRVVRVLHFLRTAPRKEGLNELLDYQAQIDLKRLETSYAIVHVFIWAIPILGFIGTVMGIGNSVGEFAGFIQTAEGGGEFSNQMRTALSGVTSGLAVAFNTTFLALVLVIPVMLATSFLQKTEEEFLLAIEEYCLEDLLPFLRIAPGEAAIAEGYEDHLHRILRLSDTWLAQFEPLVQRLSRQSEMISAQLAGIQPLVKDFTDRLLLKRHDTSRDVPGSVESPGATEHPGATAPAERERESRAAGTGRTDPPADS